MAEKLKTRLIAIDYLLASIMLGRLEYVKAIMEESEPTARAITRQQYSGALMVAGAWERHEIIRYLRRLSLIYANRSSA